MRRVFETESREERLLAVPSKSLGSKGTPLSNMLHYHRQQYGFKLVSGVEMPRRRNGMTKGVHHIHTLCDCELLCTVINMKQTHDIDNKSYSCFISTSVVDSDYDVSTSFCVSLYI